MGTVYTIQKEIDAKPKILCPVYWEQSKCKNKITVFLNMQNSGLDWMYNLWDSE